MLSPRQQQLFDYIEKVFSVEHRMPSYREMAEAMEVQAVGTIQDHVKALIQKGFIQKEGRRISLSRNRKSPVLMIPIVGEVAAGSLHEAFQHSEGALAMSPDCLKRSGAKADDFFALRVKGESMRDIGIFEGDYAICRKTERVKNGDIVVASYLGEATLKEIEFPNKKKGVVYLHPKNDEFETIELKASEDLRVLGRLEAVHRYY